MVAAVSSGVAFTANPVTGDRSRVMIEAAFGQGEVVVGGRVEPDTYTVQKAPRRLLEEHIGVKSHKIVAGPEGDVTVALDPQQAAERVLLPAAVLEIARAAIAVEDHYGMPMDIEWCIDDGGALRLVQARPVTALSTAPTARVRRRRNGARPRPRRLARCDGRAAAGAAQPVRGRLVARRRGTRRTDDEPGLASHAAPGSRGGDRRWRGDLPCRDREPRARHPLHRRGTNCHPRDPRPATS